ncbi:YadA-like family protein [Sneathia sanguinegens]|uniref:YadA-like family protein n=1 Tax=Sneathia sanguinegens TaxID=40543 RepID=A0ABT7HKG1_9FUSO|nr:YadA-like family protein [Sneathia sanguinegens]MDK9581001.1 YadA-like family protein [Sneathia sanguinegens]
MKYSLKNKTKLMVLTILQFLFYSSIGYADTIKVYVNGQNKKVLTEEEYGKIDNNEKGKYKPVIIDENNKSYTINIDNGLHYFSIRPSITDGNINNDGAKMEASMAIGPDALASKTNSMAIGLNAQALYDNSMAIGIGAKVDMQCSHSIGMGAYAAGYSSNAIGYQATTLGFFSTAVGTQATAFDTMSTALGTGSYAINQYSTALGGSSYAGENSTTVGAMSKAFGKGSVTLGAASYVGDKQKEEEYNKYNGILGYYNQLIQKNEIKEKYKKEFDEIAKIDQNKENKKWYIESMKLKAKILSEDNNSIEFGTAIGLASKVYNSYGVALGAFSTTKEIKNKGYLTNQETKDVYAVSVGGEDLKRRIQGLADGAEDDEAVTVAQLKKVQKSIQNQGANEEVDKEIKGINKKSDLALSGVSNAVAIANLPNVSGDKKFSLAASYGYYGSYHAIAIGFSGTNDKQNFTYKLSGSVNNKGNLALGIGAGVMLGDVDGHNIDKLNVKKLTEKLEFANEKIEKYEKRQQEIDKKIKELSEYKENSEKRIKELEKKLEILIKNK